MTTRETRANRRLTQRFIRTSPVCLRLVPYEKLRDDLGGWRFVRGAIRHSQMFRMIEGTQLGTNIAAQTVSVDGIDRKVEFELLGFHDAEISLHDRFELEGVWHEVVQVWPDNGYEKRASVSFYG